MSSIFRRADDRRSARASSEGRGGGFVVVGGEQLLGGAEGFLDFLCMRELFLPFFQIFQFSGDQTGLVQTFPSALVVLLLLQGVRKSEAPDGQNQQAEKQKNSRTFSFHHYSSLSAR